MTRSVSSLITTMVFLLAPGAVHAGFVIVLYDGETTITIADNGPNDASPIEGSIIYGGSHGGIVLAGLSGMSKDQVGSASNPEIILGLQSAINTSDGSHQITHGNGRL